MFIYVHLHALCRYIYIHLHMSQIEIYKYIYVFIYIFFMYKQSCMSKLNSHGLDLLDLQSDISSEKSQVRGVSAELPVASWVSDKSFISETELLEARDKVTMGPSRGSWLQSATQRRLTAVHEAGHAIVAFFLQPHAAPIHKATIVTRGNALGHVEQVRTHTRIKGLGFRV